MRRWEEVFTGADRELLKKAGMAQKQVFGSRPALLIIDVTIEFIGSTRRPALQSAEEYPTSCGEAGWAVLPGIQKLLETCRANSVPVIYTTQDMSARRFTVGPVKEAAPQASYDPKANEIPEPIKPRPSELVIPKTRASGFFGTPLLSCLRSMEIDSLLITGCTTSGCVRALVVDAFSYGYRCFVVEDCVFDRFELSHLVNLFDMNAKYADVITLDEALKYVIRPESRKGSPP
ncbi:MAG: isochorismatase family protein [Gammaproteobacteria bacterium]|nr:isochorismatase family protein [Gammaproteobacteria bacterium]